MRAHVDETLTDEELEDLVQCTVLSVEGGAGAAETLLDRGVTAIVCGSDLMALGAIQTVRRHDLRVPEDVAVVGSDDSKLIEYTDPPLTTVRQAVTAMGAAAASSLVDQIAGHPVPRNELLYRPELVVRGSTGQVPVLATQRA